MFRYYAKHVTYIMLSLRDASALMRTSSLGPGEVNCPNRVKIWSNKTEFRMPKMTSQLCFFPGILLPSKLF